jgi:hypothetical protein
MMSNCTMFLMGYAHYHAINDSSIRIKSKINNIFFAFLHDWVYIYS